MSDELETSRFDGLGRALNPVVNRRTALAVGGVGALGALLAACGGKRGSSSSGGGGNSNPTASVAPADTDFIKTLFKGGTTAAGMGLNYQFAAGQLLSTSQAPYGQASLKGINLAIKQIKASGGPNLTVNVKDWAVSTTAAADAMRVWGSASLGYAITCGFFGSGNAIAPGQAAKILMTDPGGGDIVAFQGKPYVWGTRAITPNDAYAGAVQYLAKAMPNAKRIVMAGADIGAIGDAAKVTLAAAIQQYLPGGSIVGTVYTTASSSNTYDYGPAITKIVALNPDVVFSFTWGTDPASFMKAAGSGGLKAQVIGPDFDPGSVNLAGGSMDGYMFAYDYFNADAPGNKWGELFVKEFKAQYGIAPNYYAANYYENTYFLWELIQRTLAANGDPKSGTDLQTALQSNTTLNSVYGTGTDAGSITLSPSTHTVTARPLGLFQYSSKNSGSGVKQLSSFGVAGVDFKTT
jgi:branched-chain amino acid transport system substrate-binding protein